MRIRYANDKGQKCDGFVYDKVMAPLRVDITTRDYIHLVVTQYLVADSDGVGAILVPPDKVTAVLS